MKNITVSVDDETYRLSRVRATRLATSMSALVHGYPKSFVGKSTGERDGNIRSKETECGHRGKLLNEVSTDFDARDAELHMADDLPREVLLATICLVDTNLLLYAAGGLPERAMVGIDNAIRNLNSDTPLHDKGSIDWFEDTWSGVA